MKKGYLLTALLASLFLILNSCSKTSQSDMIMTPASSVVNATLQANGTYELVLDKWENVSIYKQASHFKVSTAALNSKSGAMVYSYTPAMNFTGSDEVMLSTKTAVTANHSSGEGCNHSSHHDQGSTSGAVSYSYTYLTVKLTVTE